MLKLDTSKIKLQGVNWYNESQFAGAEKVTSGPSNEALGIKNIALYDRSDDNAFANADIEFENGVRVRGTIWLTKDKNHLRLGFYQDFDEASGKYYAREVMHMPLEIQAQVLRYASTKAMSVDVPVVTAPPATAPASAPATQASTEVADATAEVFSELGQQTFDPAMFANMTSEQISALFKK